MLGVILPSLLTASPARAGDLLLGVAPSVLAEPYDDVNALEVGIVPLDVGWRLGPRWFLEARPILNLRLLKDTPRSISHVGGLLVLQREVPVGEQGWALIGGPMVTLARQRLFEETTLTLGGELGVQARSGDFWLALSAQPGVNLYLDTPVEDRTILGHFGVAFRLGWWIDRS